MFIVFEICSNTGYTLLNIYYSLCQSHRPGRHFHVSLSDALTSREVLKLEKIPVSTSLWGRNLILPHTSMAKEGKGGVL
jgi:hypothetical protein